MAKFLAGAKLDVGDLITFGKYSHRTVGDVYKTDANYLVWLREERFKQGDFDCFSDNLNAMLDSAIATDRTLRGRKTLERLKQQYKPLESVSDNPEQDELVAELAAANAAKRPVVTSYNEDWGAW